jgi:EAL domain-containing protein (putative c-di-GMP-specific phosphodiesterase class I)
MLVDDQDVFDHMICVLLRAHGFEVIYAATVQQALDLMHHRPDLIIVDKHLCDHLINRFKDASLINAIAMIVMLDSKQGLNEESISYQVLDYIIKPFEPKDLMDHINRVLRRGEWIASSIENQRYQHSLITIRHILDEEKIGFLFQPVMGVHPWGVIGIEVYTRPVAHAPFNDPKVFFKEALRCGLYSEVESYVWQKAIGQIKKHASQLMDKTIFLNCEAAATDQYHWPILKKVLIGLDLPPKTTCIEVNQQSLDREGVRGPMHKEVLQDGYQLALDDVGGGIVSLDYLVAVRPNYIKVDRQMISGVWEDPIKKSIVKLLLRSCKEHGIKLVAEGVENTNDLNVLKEIGIDALQGYLIARPQEELIKCLL